MAAMISRETLRAWLLQKKACGEAMKWFNEGERTPEAAWLECPDAGWMIWVAIHAGIFRQHLVLVLSLILRETLSIVSPEQAALLEGWLETPMKQLQGDGTLEQIGQAEEAADLAAELSGKHSPCGMICRACGALLEIAGRPYHTTISDVVWNSSFVLASLADAVGEGAYEREVLNGGSVLTAQYKEREARKIFALKQQDIIRQRIPADQMRRLLVVELRNLSIEPNTEA